MTKEEALKILRYGDIDVLLNHYSYEEIQQVIDLVVAQPSLPSNLDEAANNYGIDIRLGYPRVMDETDKYIYNAFKAGAEWMAGQDRKIWNSSIRSVPEGNKSQILSFDAEGYFYLNRKPHPDSVEWCFAKELLPIRKKQ